MDRMGYSVSSAWGRLFHPTAEKREQETFSLRHTGDFFRKVVITNAPFQTRTYDDSGIAHIGLVDFLLRIECLFASVRD